MFILLVLAIFVVIAMIGTLPIWPHSKQWGHGPSGFAAVVILIILAVLLYISR
jgi:hypothetical protein